MGKVLHAGGSGYLPFCITPASTIPQEVVGTYYPFALSLDKLVSLFWRVKKWTYEDNLGPTGEIFSLFVNIPGPGIQDLPVDEEGLVCIDAYIYFSYFPRDNGFSYLRDFALFSGSVLKVGGLYYPKFYFQGDFRDDSIPISGSGLTPGDIGTFETGIFTMSWLGHSISAPLYSYGGGETFNPKLTAVEYWSYGGTYDTSTGAPL